MRITVEQIRKVINGLKDDLGEGFVDTDIWDTSSNKSVAFHHNQGVVPQYGFVPKHIKLFREISKVLNNALKESHYPPLGDFYLIQLNNNQLIVVLNIKPGQSNHKLSGNKHTLGYSGTVVHQQFILVDLSKTTIGALLSIAIPNVFKNYK